MEVDISLPSLDGRISTFFSLERKKVEEVIQKKIDDGEDGLNKKDENV